MIFPCLRVDPDCTGVKWIELVNLGSCLIGIAFEEFLSIVPGPVNSVLGVTNMVTFYPLFSIGLFW